MRYCGDERCKANAAGGQRDRLKTMDGFLDDMPELFEGVKKKKKRLLTKPKPEIRNTKIKTQNHHAVIYHVIRCPVCDSKKTKIARTARPIRWHKCIKCGHTFKSVEAK